jgi:hypothetical protein
VFASITEDPTLNSRMQVRRVFGRVCAGGASVLSPMVSDWLESVATVWVHAFSEGRKPGFWPGSSPAKLNVSSSFLRALQRSIRFR